MTTLLFGPWIVEGAMPARIAAWNCAIYRAMVADRSLSVSAAEEAGYAMRAMR